MKRAGVIEISVALIIRPVFAPIIKTFAPASARHLSLDAPTNMAQTEYVANQVIYWFAILAAISLQTSFPTPPFGFALFHTKGVAPAEVKMQERYRGIIPFAILQLVGMGTVLAWPEIALWLPATMLD